MNSICGIFPDGLICVIMKSPLKYYSELKRNYFYSVDLKEVEYKNFLSTDYYFFSDAEVKLFLEFCKRDGGLKPLVIKASSRQKIWNEVKKLELLKEII